MTAQPVKSDIRLRSLPDETLAVLEIEARRAGVSVPQMCQMVLAAFARRHPADAPPTHRPHPADAPSTPRGGVRGGVSGKELHTTQEGVLGRDLNGQVENGKQKKNRQGKKRHVQGDGQPDDTTWISPFWDPWKAELGGDPPKAIVRIFKPLRGTPEWEDGTLLRRWTNFLTGLKVDPKYLGSPAAQVTKFASAHALYDDPDWFLSDRERASMEGLFG